MKTELEFEGRKIELRKQVINSNDLIEIETTLKDVNFFIVSNAGNIFRAVSHYQNVDSFRDTIKKNLSVDSNHLISVKMELTKELSELKWEEKDNYEARVNS